MARDAGIVDPYTEADQATVGDRTALTRIIMVLLRHLGLAWVRDGASVVVTDSGLELAIADQPESVVARQVAKIQFPNPTLDSEYRELFRGFFPHLFLLQLLQQTGYRVTDEEYALFVNLAQSHDDLGSVVQYITAWRELTEGQQEELRGEIRRIPRWRTIGNNRAYSVSLYAFPTYIRHEEGVISAVQPVEIDAVVAGLGELQPVTYKDEEDWFAYMGDPAQKPDWYTYLARQVERAETQDDALGIVAEHGERLTQPQREEVARLQREKVIEDFYSINLGMLEPGLELVDKGRQYTTPIGIMDLLLPRRWREVCSGRDQGR